MNNCLFFIFRCVLLVLAILRVMSDVRDIGPNCQAMKSLVLFMKSATLYQTEISIQVIELLSILTKKLQIRGKSLKNLVIFSLHNFK